MSKLQAQAEGTCSSYRCMLWVGTRQSCRPAQACKDGRVYVHPLKLKMWVCLSLTAPSVMLAKACHGHAKLRLVSSWWIAAH